MPRFRLRTLMIAVAVVALACGSIANSFVSLLLLGPLVGTMVMGCLFSLGTSLDFNATFQEESDRCDRDLRSRG